jgi:type IV pilus assembly protein PilA
MKAVQKGFTLIELMIVVAIIGILAAIALPAYQDYTIRSQVSEGPSLSEGLKTAVADYYASNGDWPATEADLGYTSAVSGTYVSGITVLAGAINITYGNKVNKNITGRILTLRPAPNANGDIAWVCAGAAVPGSHVVAGADATSFAAAEMKYLPNSCKV